MKTAAFTILGLGLLATQSPAAEINKELKDTASYGIGVDIAKNWKSKGIDVDPEQFTKGFLDTMKGNKQAYTDEQIQQATLKFQEHVMLQQNAKRQEEVVKNQKAGEAFLAENKRKEGVVTTASGLQYKVLKEGTGAIPTAEDQVSVHYRGTLLDGTEFDSSYKRGQPAKFGVTGVIAGWTEALKLMKVGSKWQLWIPSQLAYAERGAGGSIGPNATLTFEVELLEIVKK